MEDFEEIAVTIRDAIRDLPNRFHSNEADIAKLERERSDLLHMAELVDLNAFEGFQLYKEIQKVERARRKLKDENEHLKHLVPFLTKWRDRLKQLDQIVGDIRKTKSQLENRSYRCRVRKDLEEKINGRAAANSHESKAAVLKINVN